MRGPLKALAVLGALVVLLTAFAGCGGDDNSDSGATTTSTTSTTDTSAGGGGATGGGGADTGGGGGDTGGGGVDKNQTLEIAADPTGALKFSTEQLSAKPGRVTIQMGNPAPVEHAVSIIGNGVSAHGNTVGQNGIFQGDRRAPSRQV